MIKTVVIAVDGSEAGREAVGVGLDLAEGLRAEAVFVHGSEPLGRRVFESAADRDSAPAEQRDPVLRDAEALARDRGIETRFQVWPAAGVEDVAGVVTAVADSHRPSMIVVGSRGRGSVTSAVLGSVSRAILGSTDVPVVVVHAPRG